MPVNSEYVMSVVIVPAAFTFFMITCIVPFAKVGVPGELLFIEKAKARLLQRLMALKRFLLSR